MYKDTDMLDRQDIDALMMGALYGELSPAESTRLEEHLSGHPQDRLALDGMTRARQALRDSHVLAVQAEPPAGVIALLLQEAARRAPAPRAGARWFARFVVLLRHPAMAAAAVIVLVAGVATTLYNNNADHAMVVPEVAGVPPGESTAAQAQPTRADNAPAGSAAMIPADDVAPGTEGAVGNGDGFGADLAADKLAAPAAPEADRKEGKQEERTRADRDQARKAELGKTAGATGAAERPRYVEVTTPEPKPKTFEDGDVAVSDTQDSTTERSKPKRSTTGGAPSDPAVSAGAKLDLNRPSKPVASPPPAAAVADDGESMAGRVATEATETKNEVAPTSVAGGMVAPTQSAPAKKANDGAAKEQHARVIELTKANKCKDAAKAAAAIYERYPDYYAEFVANDRRVKACRPYIETERKKRSDAMKSRARTNYDQPAETTK
jgi:hypothetical protein